MFKTIVLNWRLYLFDNRHFRSCFCSMQHDRVVRLVKNDDGRSSYVLLFNFVVTNVASAVSNVSSIYMLLLHKEGLLFI